MACSKTSAPVSALLLVWCLSALPAVAQEERYREKQVLEPETGTWVTAPTSQQAVTGALAEARTYLAAGEPGKAQKLLKDWIEANAGEERYYEGVYLYGESYFLQKSFWKAYQQYEIVAENASGELFRVANERCVDVARAFLSGQRRILWKIFRLPAYDDGIEILDRVWERMPGTPLGELALKLKADYFFRSGQMDLAQDEYANLVQQYPSGRYVQLAMLRAGEAAEASFPGIRYDAQSLLNANERYEQVLAEFPPYAEHEQVPQRLEGIREQRAQKDFAVARWYEKTKKPQAAEFYYRMVLREWPDTLAATEARTRLLALGVTPGEAETPSSPEERP